MFESLSVPEVAVAALGDWWSPTAEGSRDHVRAIAGPVVAAELRRLAMEHPHTQLHAVLAQRARELDGEVWG